MASDALPMGYRPGPRRPGTPEEAHALAHPLRIRILRLALDTPRTNRELADLLGVNPGTALHHVRILVDHGFLVAGETRRGKRGSREVPYQATGKSWVLDFRDVEIGGEGHGPAMIAASHAEYLEATPEDRLDALRIAMRLSPGDRQAMVDRLYEVVEEFREKESAHGEPMALFWGLHLRRDV